MFYLVINLLEVYQKQFFVEILQNTFCLFFFKKTNSHLISVPKVNRHATLKDFVISNFFVIDNVVREVEVMAGILFVSTDLNGVHNFLYFPNSVHCLPISPLS